jgi:cytoplasmic iron level regulating protein YaaA (DUF328/UPF0246 family)
MLIFLSPAKTLDFTTPATTDKFTVPKFLDQTEKLITKYKKFSSPELSAKMKVSEKIADLNHKRFQLLTTNLTPKNAKQALFAYKGDVYRDIEVEKYTEKQLDFAQKYLRIISGLYGLVKPLDLIQPYRLEMHLETNFWQETLTKNLTQEKDPILLSLASEEYFKAIKKTPGKKIITVYFKEKTKIIPIYSKIARGTLANFIIKNKITKPADLQNFSEDHYKFDLKESTETSLVFRR